MILFRILKQIAIKTIQIVNFFFLEAAVRTYMYSTYKNKIRTFNSNQLALDRFIKLCNK